ncbi:hypothetical protein OTUT144_0267 [Orientia tsutsugamushi str. UT144]|uniref:Uncharacterized protein n=1 Tax=Orientia tsutsugamushi str. UT144 TaxID=1441384 RepID=A0A0F3RN97_ORITS|nr:hypothetical protein [Orientia tsutsugamushi]KJW07662.1 hypothetical protein OTUT144_0267 [Orientia tsutsugamushi str. UT144]
MNIRVLRFMIRLIALVKFSDIYVLEYGLEVGILQSKSLSKKKLVRFIQLKIP